MLFFAAFLAAGLGFEYMVTREFVAIVRTYAWRATPCEILSCQVDDTLDSRPRGSDFSIRIEYRYSVDGHSWISRQFKRKGPTFSDYGQTQRLVLRYPPGRQAQCYVNPAVAEEAILQRDSLWFGLVLLFPLIFVAVGGGSLFFTLREMFNGSRPIASTPARPGPPISSLARAGQGRGGLVLLFSFFLLLGGSALYLALLRPSWRIFQARDWQTTPCRVILSEVKTHSGEDGPTFSVNILYAYEIGGREYRANRYHFMGGSSSGYDGKAAVVRRYPPGMKAVCYVNPHDPTDAVLERGFTVGMWWGLLPVAFVLVGVGGFGFVLRRRRQDEQMGLITRAAGSISRTKQTGDVTLQGLAESSGDAPVVLKASVAPVTKLIGAILVAGFWNGIVSVFVTDVVSHWLRHQPEWFPTIFMIPFVLAGLGLIGFVIYTFLALFNARPKLTLTPGAPTLGGSCEMEWKLSGRTQVVRRLQIFLEGREEATYQRGTTTTTDKSVFAKIELLNSTDRLAIKAGQARVSIPPGLMHSWTAPHNKIVWAIRVEGDIPRWPDIKEEFPVIVRPRKPDVAAAIP